ncbi:Pimeloyl-ACP methyl ester carboxylesterase [Paenibacillus algorifonticola]|uniref:Pimeloyl-ACP methyl ester carboxylesterase n=1 Tax=Paenibacillus algorifonticola TaxID=684063 RepID=A0A1I2FJ79_9BACL|nr:alpha/beta hydrolase [Paenibacillus algorifonticola]SFF05315.1 Pimeloyl-ACP methyl ester carboxylesterase [Paenibacillus algorifonticola]
MDRQVSTMQVGEYVLEYSIVGEGPPLLLFHGGHSNCYEEFGYQNLVASGYSIITPSRSGYSQTFPIPELQQACDLYLALLDHLHIAKVHVIAASAGGPTGILFCAQFPERVASLTLQCAISMPWLSSNDKAYRMGRLIFKPGVEKGTWLILAGMNNLLPRLMFRMLLSSFSTLSPAEAYARLDNLAIELFREMNNRQRSHKGFLIDLEQTQKDYTRELCSIKAPTLIMHSKNDRSVAPSHAEYAKAHIVHSEAFILDSWGHLIWIGKHAAEFDRKQIAFLAENQ